MMLYKLVDGMFIGNHGSGGVSSSSVQQPEILVMKNQNKNDCSVLFLLWSCALDSAYFFGADFVGGVLFGVGHAE